MNEVFTARQAARTLGIPYVRLLYALDRYGTRRYDRYAHRLVTLEHCRAALAQVQPKYSKRASA